MITSFDAIFEHLKTKPKKRLVAAYANDSHTIGAISLAIDAGIVDATLVGDAKTIKNVCETLEIDYNKFNIIQETNENKAALTAVEFVSKGEGDILMKGLCSTDKYMRAILNKEIGLLPPKGILSHITLMRSTAYHKLLLFSDIAVIPAPDLKQKIAMCGYLIKAAKSLGIEKPKVAIIAATEQMSPGMQACVDAAIISKMADRGQIVGAYVDGPLAVDVAIDEEAKEIKKVSGPVAADADCLLFPNIEAGNVFYKTVGKFTNSQLAAMVVGANAPCVLSSRGDTTETKLNSIALAALNC
ncbi:MAG: phosphate butyryltransferase [Prevotellaceae bacterium]|jgi:phosphate butyryltransferase|nr:phosphate butyryltransferase [Prevotellaceae bacterium]